MQGSKQGAAKVISYYRNREKKHGDVHYTFTRLTKLKRTKLAVPFYPVLLFILSMEFLLGVFTGLFNYQ